MKVIITGVAGFIGSNLAIRLLKENHEVIGIDNLSYGSLLNIESIKNSRKFKFIYGDITNPAIFYDIKGDIIVHLASQKIPRYSNSLRTLEENQAMLKNVINKCLLDRIKLVYASTSDVYGKNSKIPYKEDSDLCLGPTVIKRWAYAVSKIYGEHLIIGYNQQYSLCYSIARFFGAYGINQNLTWWGGPQSVFITNALKKLPLEIHGDGKQSRTFTYIEDTISAFKHLILDEKSNNEIFNIAGNPEEEIKIIDLAKMIWKFINGDKIKPKIKIIPYSTFGNYEDVRRRVPDISKIKSMFGYSPKYTLEKGLKITIDWQSNYI